MKSSLIKKILFSLFSITLLFFVVTPVFAQNEQETVELDNPISVGCDPTIQNCVPVIVGNVIQTVLGIVGSLALVTLIVGAMRWLLSGGNQEQVKKGTKTMLYAAIGLFVVFASYGILSTVMQALKGG